MSESNPSILSAKRRQMPQQQNRRRCCATCDYLSDDGECEIFGESPPLEFIEQENDCEEYQDVIPF